MSDRCLHCNVEILPHYQYCQYCADTELVGWDLTVIARLGSQLAELREVSAKVIAATRGGGGINPNAVEALRQLQILLEATSEPSHPVNPHE